MVQTVEELLVSDLGAQPFGVGQEGVRLVDGGQRRPRIPLGDLTDVPGEQRLLHRPRAEQVERQRQDPPVGEHPVVLGDDRLQLRLGPRDRLLLQQRVQHRHEVRLPGTERPGQERPPARARRDPLGDQPQRGIEGLGEGVGDDVLLQRAPRRLVADRIGQPQHVVLGPGTFGDVDDISQQLCHQAPPSATPPRTDDHSDGVISTIPSPGVISGAPVKDPRIDACGSLTRGVTNWPGGLSAMRPARPLHRRHAARAGHVARWAG